VKYPFSEAQKKIVRQLGFDPERDYDEDAADALLEAVSDYLMARGFGNDYVANDIGNLCEDIITIITK